MQEAKEVQYSAERVHEVAVEKIAAMQVESDAAYDAGDRDKARECNRARAEMNRLVRDLTGERVDAGRVWDRVNDMEQESSVAE